jgi:hypothetical protein
MQRRDYDSRRPLSAEEYFQLAANLAEQQAALAQQQAELLKQLGIGAAAPPYGEKVVDPLAKLLAEACGMGPYEQVVASYDEPDGKPRSGVSYCDGNAPALVIEKVHNLPQRARHIIRPGAQPSISQMWRNIQDSGDYPTLEAHLANRTPKYEEVGTIMPVYEIYGAKPKEDNKWRRY